MTVQMDIGEAILTTDFFLDPGITATLPPKRDVLKRLFQRGIVLMEEWEELDEDAKSELEGIDSIEELTAGLMRHRLLTDFQAGKIRENRECDLVLGHYRVLDALGQGGMGMVFRGENTYLRKEVAIKMISSGSRVCDKTRHRFYAEARAIARLQHPNIVHCVDAGEHAPGIAGAGAVRNYFVMELVRGRDLEAIVKADGALSIETACDIFRQVADALAEAHRIGLVHRDLKPSNIMVTAEGRAKLLDFGLVLHPQRRITEPGSVLGTVGYMAPEQAREPHLVDSRADIFSLGASMYLALTGKEPFPSSDNAISDIMDRLRLSTAPIQALRPEIPGELADLVNRMLDLDRDGRPSSARVIALTLAGLVRATRSAKGRTSVAGAGAGRAKPTVLVVDDESSVRKLVRAYLEPDFNVIEASDGQKALETCQKHRADLVLLDVNMPGKSGHDLVSMIRDLYPPQMSPPILLSSGVIPPESLEGLGELGADGYLPKPFSRAECRSQVNKFLAGPGTDFEDGIRSESFLDGGKDFRKRFAFLGNVLSAMQQESLGITPDYGKRLSRYLRSLAANVEPTGEYARLRDDKFIELLETAAPFHDIGMLAVPNTTTSKISELSGQEQIVVQTHTMVGENWLLASRGEAADCDPCMLLAAEIARSHHENWDGTGYPDGLAGEDIPLAARAVGLVSVYDALRSRRCFRPGLTHNKAVSMIAVERATCFDPPLLAAFVAAAARFNQIFLDGK